MIDRNSERAQEIIATALEHVDSAGTALTRALTWIDGMQDSERDRLTRAANAVELASCRIRNVFSDTKPVLECL